MTRIARVPDMETEILDLHAKIEKLQAALTPFAKIKPSTFHPADGRENEGYLAYVVIDQRIDFTGADLAQARAALEETK
jgi:hypothetical protein